MDIREYLKSNILVFDGATGTLFKERRREYGNTCEMAVLDMPGEILEIHRDYIEAGARAIKTDTFATSPVSPLFSGGLFRKAVSSACRIARKAAGESREDIFIFADIGPVTGINADKTSVYRRICDAFLEEGLSNFLFETLNDAEAISEICGYIKSKDENAYIIVSFAVQPDGYTREGVYYADLLRSMDECANVDAIGMNCVSSALHLKNLIIDMQTKIGALSKPLSVMPNGGYPKVSTGKRIMFYDGDPDFFSDQLTETVQGGYNVRILGGCCGTRPEFIKKLCEGLSGEANSVKTGIAVRKAASQHVHTAAAAPLHEENLLKLNKFWNKIESGKKVIAVELDPPKQADGDKFMSGAWMLKSVGADAITIADCPTARARMDSSLVACKLKRELDIDTIPHMTCRDRNLNATKALLLGLAMEGVDNVLAITGDPVPAAERDAVKSVFQFNSKMLAGFITSLNENELQKPFRVFGALNLNVRHFDRQLQLAHEKIKNGVSCFMTQPVHSQEALDNLKTARKELDARILGGIMPVVSYRNARFMNSEISGINVAECITEQYEGKSKDECTKLAIDISADIAERIAPHIDGFYLITPFMRMDIITAIIERISVFCNG